MDVISLPQILLLIALPMCIAQLTITGPVDGNRAAQGLTVEEGKGIRYTNQDGKPWVDRPILLPRGEKSRDIIYPSCFTDCYKFTVA